VEIRAGHKVDLVRVLVPLIIVLFVPGLLSCWLESRSRAAMVWLNWILLASWLYWISAIEVGDISAYFGSLRLHPAIGVAFGSLLYSLPPLLAIASALIALSPQLLPGKHSWSDLSRLLKSGVAGSASSIVPLGIFLVGSGMYEYGWMVATGSMIAAYLAYKVISWWAWRWSFVEMRSVDRGEFIDRVRALAEKAGVQVRGVYVLRNRMPREANAFAMSGHRIGVTEGLLENLTRREVDAVVGHELGHLKGGHVGAQSILFWVYFLVAGPLVGYLLTRFNTPEWVRGLPVAPALAVLVMAYVSQRHEFSADARAAQITGDPEAKIAALARLARLTGAPLEWGGIQGSILSHPSMRARVLSIAHRSGLGEARALALLENPDQIGGESYDLQKLRRAVEGGSSPVHYSLPPDLRNADPVFNTTAKAAHHTKASWRSEGLIVVLLFGLAYLAGVSFPPGDGVRKSTLIFLAGIPVVFWLMLRAEIWGRRTFLNSLREKIRRNSAGEGGLYVGLLPGAEIRRFEGFGEWDLGFLYLDSDSLTYRGERAQFSVPRTSIGSIELRKGSFTWTHSQRVLIYWTGGAFSLQVPGLGPSRRRGGKLAQELSRWWNGTVGLEKHTSLPPPMLPAIQTDYLPLPKIAWLVAKKGGTLFFGCLIVGPLLPFSMFNALVPFAAPLLVALDALPALLNRRVPIVHPTTQAAREDVPQPNQTMTAPQPD
jgi:heat shock protein HtpX